MREEERFVQTADSWWWARPIEADDFVVVVADDHDAVDEANRNGHH